MFSAPICSIKMPSDATCTLPCQRFWTKRYMYTCKLMSVFQAMFDIKLVYRLESGYGGAIQLSIRQITNVRQRELKEVLMNTQSTCG